MKLINKLITGLGDILPTIRSKKSMNSNLEMEIIDRNTSIEQKRICDKYSATFLPTDDWEIIGVAFNAKQGTLPINGLRKYPLEDTSGWFIWTEELSDDPEFFVPYHTVHIEEWLKDITKYLGLAPGWRFLVAGDYVDVWFDEALLNEETDK